MSFDDLGSGKDTRIPMKERTMEDMLTDVGWLSGETKERMKQRYLDSHGQYFDNGERVAAGPG